MGDQKAIKYIASCAVLIRSISIKVIGASALAALLWACDGQGVGRNAGPSAVFHATDITGVDYAKDFSMPDTSGKQRTLAEFGGKVVVVFFGLTHCPDVCPTTMAELREAKKLMGKDGDKVQGVFVTLDPERDTPELLKNYAAAFDPSFIALRGSAEQTAQMAKDFHLYYKKNPATGAGGYSLDHTAASFVYDPQGRLRLYVRYAGGAQKLAEDLRQLL